MGYSDKAETQIYYGLQIYSILKVEIMGSAGISNYFTHSNTSSHNSVDPIQYEADQFRLNQLQFGLGSPSYGSSTTPFLANQPWASVSDPNSLAFQQQGYNAAQSPLINASDWYNQSQGQLGQMYGNLSGVNQAAQGYSQGLINPSQSIQGLNNAVYAGQADLGNLYQTGLQQINPQAAIDQGRNYFQQIVNPQLQTQYGTQGLGVSGALLEAQNKAGAQIALPIAQQALGQQYNLQNQYQGGMQNLINQGYAGTQGLLQQYQNQIGQLANQGYQQQYGLGQQYGQNQFGLNQQYPNANIGLNNQAFNQAQQGFNLSDFNRNLQQQQYAQQFPGYVNLLNATPWQVGGHSDGNQAGYGIATEAKARFGGA